LKSDTCRFKLNFLKSFDLDKRSELCTAMTYRFGRVGVFVFCIVLGLTIGQVCGQVNIFPEDPSSVAEEPTFSMIFSSPSNDDNWETPDNPFIFESNATGQAASSGAVGASTVVSAGIYALMVIACLFTMW